MKARIFEEPDLDELHRRQYKRRTWAHIRLGLIGTSAWGILEVIILRFIGHLEHFWPQMHTRFMKLMHGLFGGVVTPFDPALETDPSKRSWETRTPFHRVNAKGQDDPTGLFVKKGEMVILPNEEILQLILRSNIRPTVSYCFCRLYAKEKGKPCPMNAPIRTCLTLSIPQNIDSLVQKEPREDLVRQKKAIYNMLKKCDEIGLVHQVIWIPSPNYTYVICNCCPCCCEVLGTRTELKKERKYHQLRLEKALEEKQQLINLESLNNEAQKKVKLLDKQIKEHKKGANTSLTPIVARSIYISEPVEEVQCNNCGVCETRCYFDARKMIDGKMEYDPQECYGCGLCVSSCPEHGIQLVKRKKSVLLHGDDSNAITHIHPHRRPESFTHQH